MWKNIGKFLGRFNNLKPSKNFIKKESTEVIKALLGVEINSKEIEERNGILYLRIENPALKNEIFIKKEKILEVLKDKLGPQSPRDIRF